MKIKIITLLLLIFIGLPSMGQTNEKVIFTDSLTTVQLYFPPNTELKDISHISFKKCVAVMKKNDISIYSMKNPEGEQYSWTRINDFDKNSQYGNLIRSEKIKNTAEGWHRYYQSKTKSGKEYITCITLIRGNVYAIYLVESAYNANDLKSKEVVAASIFPAAKEYSKKRKDQISGIDWIVIGAIILSGLCLWNFRRKMHENFKIVLISVSSIAILIYLIFFAWLTIWPSIGFGVINAIFWSACLYSNSWSDFWKRLEEILKNIKD